MYEATVSVAASALCSITQRQARSGSVSLRRRCLGVYVRFPSMPRMLKRRSPGKGKGR